MNEKQHAPAPWFWSDNVPDAPKNYCTIVDADGFTIVEPSPMGEANARLISAAPELLAAAQCALADLEGILPEFDPEREHPGWETLAELRAAIAKAAGVQHETV